MEHTRSHFFIHRSAERWNYYASAPRIFWSDQLACWVTADHPIILSILKDKSFAAVDFTRETAKLSQRFSIDLDATEALLAKVPLGLEGSEHAAVRRKMALDINTRSPEALRQFSNFAEEAVRRSFEEKSAFDIVSKIFSPSVRILMSTLSGVSLPAPQRDVSLPLIFDRMLSVNHRKHLNSQIEATVNEHAELCPMDEALSNTALTVVGSDSILGTLTESFVAEVERNTNKPLNEIAWSDKPLVTAVPYVERIATKTTVVAGSSVEKGQRIRLCLDAFRSGQSDGLDYYFGAGRHVCLGKALSLQAWRTLTGALGAIEKRVRIEKVAYRKSDFLFNTPTLVEIAVS